MSEPDVTWDALPPEQEAAFQQMAEQMVGSVAFGPTLTEAQAAQQEQARVLQALTERQLPPVAPTCATCRWHLVDPADGHTPRWGVCLRVAGTPPAPMAAVAEDGSGAMLRTSPRFSCRAWEA